MLIVYLLIINHNKVSVVTVVSPRKNLEQCFFWWLIPSRGINQPGVLRCFPIHHCWRLNCYLLLTSTAWVEVSIHLFWKEVVYVSNLLLYCTCIPQRTGYTYRSELDIAASTFRSYLQNMTAFMHTLNPHAKFVWRLLPHTGNVDEMVYNASTREEKSAASKLHFDGSFWNDVSHETPWVSIFNEIIVENAKLWNDSYLDWHTMSVLALNYYRSTPVNGKIINGHIDSQHFCSGGVARHTNILLQTLLLQLFGAA